MRRNLKWAPHKINNSEIVNYLKSAEKKQTKWAIKNGSWTGKMANEGNRGKKLLKIIEKNTTSKNCIVYVIVLSMDFWWTVTIINSAVQLKLHANPIFNGKTMCVFIEKNMNFFSTILKKMTKHGSCNAFYVASPFAQMQAREKNT